MRFYNNEVVAQIQPTGLQLDSSGLGTYWGRCGSLLGTLVGNCKDSLLMFYVLLMDVT